MAAALAAPARMAPVATAAEVVVALAVVVEAATAGVAAAINLAVAAAAPGLTRLQYGSSPKFPASQVPTAFPTARLLLPQFPNPQLGRS
jgi:hypothetical protein